MKRNYFKNIKGKRSEPMEFEQIKTNIYKNDLIWYEGIDGWKKASEIEELKEFAISEPPKTESEEKKEIYKRAMKPTLLFYILFSLALGIFSGFLEGTQYISFQRKIDRQVQYLKDNGSYNSGGGFSQMEVYVEKPFSDGLYSRWYSYNRGYDNEQVSYEKRHNIFFRPYKGLYDVVNLSKSERDSMPTLLLNFILSALITNLILLPFIYLFNVYKQKRKYKKEDLNGAVL
jgi:hypothetical protein